LSRNKLDRGVGLALVLCVLASQLLGASTAAAQLDVGGWRYTRKITLPPGLAQQGFVEIEPDAELFAGAAPGLRDVRIVERTSGKETPYQLVVQRAVERRSEMPLVIRDLGQVGDRYTTFAADLGQHGVLHNGIEILTSSEEFQRTVVVEGSSDGRTWITLQSGQRIFDFRLKERGFVTRDTTVSYTETTSTQLRIRIEDDGQAPLTVTGARAFFVEQEREGRVDYAASVGPPVEVSYAQATQYLLDLGGSGLPSSAVRVTASTENFLRRVTIESSADRTAWRRLPVTAVLYSFRTPKFVGGNDTFSYAETTDRYLRLSIVNEDSPPLDVQAIEVSGVRRKLIFEATPGEAYDLYYGNVEVGRPSYDLRHFFEYLATDDLPLALLGAEGLNPGLEEPTEPFTERYPWILPVVIAVAAAFVAVLLAGVFRSASKALPPK
jgi:hypothetical protein